MFDHDAAQAAVTALLRAAGVKADDHTANTPHRSAAAWAHMLAGYDTDPGGHLATTFPVADPGLIIVTGIEVHSTCAHHLLPITGTATVAYRPEGGTGRVVGLSKLSRVVEGYARRLQVQEQLGRQVVGDLGSWLHPEGAGVIISAEHGCMTIRGIQQRGTLTTTHSWIRGWTDPANADRAAVLAAHLAAAV